MTNYLIRKYALLLFWLLMLFTVVLGMIAYFFGKDLLWTSVLSTGTIISIATPLFFMVIIRIFNLLVYGTFTVKW